MRTSQYLMLVPENWEEVSQTDPNEIAQLIDIEELRKVTKNCSLCNSYFIADSRFSRFCSTCKEGNEVYRFAEAV